MRYLFNVFGHTLRVEMTDARWRSHWVGADGKLGPAQLAIPPDVAPADLAQYLYDIYHENATPTNGDVFEIGPK